MKTLISATVCSLFVVAVSVPNAVGDAKEDAIKKERMRYAGAWQVVSAEADGTKLSDEDAKAFRIINEADGKWAIEQSGKVVARGTSEIDPTAKIRTVDLTQTEGDGKGQKLLGIYELSDDTRKVCFAQPGGARPTEFSAPSGSGRILALMKKEKK